MDAKGEGLSIGSLVSEIVNLDLGIWNTSAIS